MDAQVYIAKCPPPKDCPKCPSSLPQHLPQHTRQKQTVMSSVREEAAGISSIYRDNALQAFDAAIVRDPTVVQFTYPLTEWRSHIKADMEAPVLTIKLATTVAKDRTIIVTWANNALYDFVLSVSSRQPAMPCTFCTCACIHSRQRAHSQHGM